MKIALYNLDGKSSGTTELSDAVFKAAVKPSVVHQVFVQQMNNQREPYAATKTRGDVRGGGKKPWRQKGTGRARHGSTRSPIWVGGGVSMGPKAERNYHTKINKATRRLATVMCLSDKAKNSNLYVVSNLDFSAPKTKLFAAFLKALPAKGHSWLVLTAGKNDAVIKQTKNLQKVEARRAEDVAVVDLVKKQSVVLTLDAVKKLEAMYA